MKKWAHFPIPTGLGQIREFAGDFGWKYNCLKKPGTTKKWRKGKDGSSRIDWFLVRG